MQMNTWYALREFETREITSRIYRNRHGRELSACKAREISSNFVQAREYFRNASESDFTVRPLLLYYGVASLSRGLTLFLDPRKREASLKNSHGLQACDWGKDLSEGLTQVGNLRIRLTRGIFYDLLSATDNRYYFRHNSSAVNWSLGAQIPPRGSEFKLKVIVARIPQVSDQYSAWTDRPLPFVVLNALRIDRAEGIYRFSVSNIGPGDIERVFPCDRFPGRSVRDVGDGLEVESRSPDGAFFAQRFGMLDIGDIVLFGPLQSNLYFTPLAACFMVSFILGMLCRYYPTAWIQMSRTEKGDAFYPLATRLLDWILGSLPSMVVDILRGPYDFEQK